MDKTEEDKTRKAESDLRSIDRLLNSSAFNDYYLRRLEEKRLSLATEILENDQLDSSKRESLRLLYNELGHIIDMPKADKAAIRASFKEL
tara:strand:- start:376 stop:645 length:270 start_codon:yes stop_codon:yes gene_type:complete